MHVDASLHRHRGLQQQFSTKEVQLTPCVRKSSTENCIASYYHEVSTFARITLFPITKMNQSYPYNIILANLHYNMIFLADRWNHIPYNPGWASSKRLPPI